MNIHEKTRTTLSYLLFFHSPCLSFSDIALAMYLYENFGKRDNFFEIVNQHKRDFSEYSTVERLVKDFYGQEKITAEKENQKAIDRYIKNQKAAENLKKNGWRKKDIEKIKAVAETFQGYITA